MEKSKLAFICRKGLETFIEPIVQQFEKFEEYQVRRYYVQTQGEIIAAIKWADKVLLEWANETAVFATQVYDLKKKGVIVRLHSYESLIAPGGNSILPQQIDWTVVDYLVFVAPHIKEIIKGRMTDIDDRVETRIIPNGLDIDKIIPNKELNMYDIAYVCNISHKKEPALALQIMAELVKLNPAFRLHVAGQFQDERYELYMKHMIKEMGIADNIIFYGFVSDMDTFWQGKGAILSTSIHEGHPMNIMEGAARGLLPVVHNFYGAKELYPATWLFNTVQEAVDSIFNHIPFENYRQYIIDRGWTIANQVTELKKLVEQTGGQE